jgi:outer membrane protein
MFDTPNMRILALSAAMAAFASVTPAQTAAPGGTSAPAASAGSSATKVGIVNIQDAIGATNEGKKEFEALQAKFTPKQNELKQLNDEVEGLKKTYDAQKDKLSPDASATQVRTIETKQKTLQRNLDDAQSEFQQAEQEVVNRIGGKMLTVMEKYAKSNGYTMILDVSNPQSPVLYASEATNITKELIDAYNAESGVAPPATPAAAKPATPAATRPAGAATRPPATSAPTPKKPQ